MNEVVAKHQHVPVADWFLTGEAGRETTVVNLYPSGSGAGRVGRDQYRSAVATSVTGTCIPIWDATGIRYP